MNKPEPTSPAASLLRIPANPIGATALALLQACRQCGATVLVIAANESRAVELVTVLGGMEPERRVALFPPWDCLPHDRLPPSAAVLGRRAAVLALAGQEAAQPSIIVATPEALVQRVAEVDDSSLAPLELETGAPFDPEGFAASLGAKGYWPDERVDEPGEYASAGATFDVFPADAETPVRIEHEDGRIVSLRLYDPLDQRSIRETARCRIPPARETPPTLGGQALPAEWDGPRELVANLFPEALLVLDPSAQRRALDFVAFVAEVQAASPSSRSGTAPNLYASGEAVEASLERPLIAMAEDEAAVPRFALESDPERAFATFVKSEQEAGRRIVLVAPEERVLRRMVARASRATGLTFGSGESWRDAIDETSAATGVAVLSLGSGFRDDGFGLTVIAAADLLGSRASSAQRSSLPREVDPDAEWRIGDAVVHREHGVCILKGLERVAGPDAGTETIRLAFAEEEMLLLPVQEADELWRYGGEAAGVKPDALHGSAWKARRDKVAEDIARAVRGIATLAAERASRRTPAINPPGVPYERFAARFPFAETADQAAAIADVLSDLRSGRPMDRLVCGDVGFGKTEVALRAAAAVALSGRQVAIAAPTTVLVRQHLLTFRRRFAGLGVEVAELSRFVPPAEARETRARLAKGGVRVVIGTHALVGKGVSFRDLALVVIDEEQRFGERHKEALRKLGDADHVLAMTATPIPRTLQLALSGLREVSIIATPPVARRPIRTTLESFTPERLSDILRREKARGGQSFLVCPHIDDLAPLAETLARVCPDLDMVTLHARLAPADIDAAMIRFAAGEGDCLLATNIVESGLDLPAANTMVIWRPDRFGLAQLHQLRGRVGRGRSTGICYLLASDEAGLTPAARRRLATLSALDRPGAGFTISARDLDLRGSGDLFGPEQSGHLTMIGTGLARHIAEQELRAARGEEVEERWRPVVAIADPGDVPPDFVPDEEARLNVYLRLAGLHAIADLEDFTDELMDRFGAPPEPLERLLAVVALSIRTKALGLERIDIGPEGVGVTLRRGGPHALPWVKGPDRTFDGAPLTFRDGKVVWSRAGSPPSDLPRAKALIAALEHLAARDTAEKPLASSARG
jgi:transcription-repair coupling factor (superfamily II helicase)